MGRIENTGSSAGQSGAVKQLPPAMARNYIEDMLGELSDIARRAGLSELDSVLSLAKLASRGDGEVRR